MFYYFKKKQEHFDFKEALTSIGAGVLGVAITAALIKTLALVVIFQLHTWRFFELSAHPLILTLCCLLVLDFLYYWMHRVAHSVNIGWAAHIVHHSARSYNLSVGLRLGVTQHAFAVFYLPLPLLGFPPQVIVSAYVISGAFQFVQHSTLVKWPVWLEYILITPRLHKAHHSISELHHNKNFGGIFVFWDKLFCTYHPVENERFIQTGVEDIPYSYNILKVNFDYFSIIFRKAYQADNWKHSMKHLFGKPGWQSDHDVK